ncbi:MAG TPA: hypothetical protein VNZ47_02035 [Candidatus Dormibacteraeota bacterium]|nr:hypothetical protein [Candidatus Dormibacteraeota bacterium]
MSLFAFAKDAPRPILVSHNDIKGPRLDQVHTEELKIFPDGRVSYKEQGNDRKIGSFSIRLTPQKLGQLTKLIDSQEIRSLPAEIPSQIRTIDYNWDKKVDLYRKGSQQTVAIRNFYPLLNSHRPAYPKALIELECMLQDIQRRAAKRPAPTGDEDFCPEALGKTR